MGLFGAPFAYRRLLTELRGIRRALERQADVQELQAQYAPRKGAQSFRGFSREAVPGDGQGSSVSYVDPKEMALALEKEGELVALLGRSPTPEELERAMVGDIE